METITIEWRTEPIVYPDPARGNEIRFRAVGTATVRSALDPVKLSDEVSRVALQPLRESISAVPFDQLDTERARINREVIEAIQNPLRDAGVGPTFAWVIRLGLLVGGITLVARFRDWSDSDHP